MKVIIGDRASDYVKPAYDALSERGFEVTLCEKDGMRLVDCINNVNPDVVVMDMFMPNIDAFGVLSEFNDNDNRPIFIVVSNFDNDTMQRDILTSGASFYMLKPFLAQNLVERIVSLVKYKPLGSSIKKYSSTDLEVMITGLLHQIGVPPHVKGYSFVRTAILMSIEKPSVINAITKELYPSIAKEHGTTASRVERAIRHAIEVSFTRGDIDVLDDLFGYTINNERGKPTNSEFIAMIADKITLDLKSVGIKIG